MRFPHDCGRMWSRSGLARSLCITRPNAALPADMRVRLGALLPARKPRRQRLTVAGAASDIVRGDTHEVRRMGRGGGVGYDDLCGGHANAQPARQRQADCPAGDLATQRVFGARRQRILRQAGE